MADSQPDDSLNTAIKYIKAHYSQPPASLLGMDIFINERIPPNQIMLVNRQTYLALIVGKPNPQPEEYAKWIWQRCTARRERRSDTPFHGRCELKKQHKGDHCLERGLDYIRWSTHLTS